MIRRMIWIGASLAVLIPTGIGLTRWSPWHATRADGAAAGAEAARDMERVELPPEKFAAAHLQFQTIGKHRVQQVRTIPGKIEYRGTRRVDLKAPVDSILHQVLAKPGSVVKPGTRLAVLDSTEIGMVRAEVEKNKAELEIARQAHEWAETIAKNLEDLLELLNHSPKPVQIEKEFEQRILGDHRQQVLAAYSRYHLADELWADVKPLVEKGAISSLTAKQRQSNLEVATVEFRSVCEQSRFDAKQKRGKTRAEEDYAARLLSVSQQKLRTMLGAFSEFVEIPETGPAKDKDNGLTRYYLIAPIEGTVEKRLAANVQRVSAGTSLYVVANTDNLQVSAEIRERDWQALSLREGEPLVIKVPALNNHEFEAQVDYVGRTVSPESQAIPLVANISNSKHLLKPGMFVWVSVPLGEPQEALTIPPSALMTHEGKKFVFVEEGPRVFRRVDVSTGPETQEWVAITHGLEPNQKIVAEGAFILKSALLLVPEDD